MSEISADFGIVLAYIVPGFLSLWSVAYCSNTLTHLFRTDVKGEQRAFNVFFLAVICLAAGMFLSLIRAATIDYSFKSDIPARLSWFCDHDLLECRAALRVEPDFGRLTCDGIRESFLLVESRYKRPYQFYGNMALALIVAAVAFACRLRTSTPRVGRYCFAVLVLFWAIGVFAFYSGERRAHYRYTQAVETLNKADCPSTKQMPGINFEVQSHH